MCVGALLMMLEERRDAAITIFLGILFIGGIEDYRVRSARSLLHKSHSAEEYMCGVPPLGCVLQAWQCLSAGKCAFCRDMYRPLTTMIPNS